MATFKSMRQTVLKEYATPDPHNLSTPRMLSARSHGGLRGGLDAKDVFHPVINRAARRNYTGRRRLPGVGLSPQDMPWKSAE